jgi:hypothetical protein
MKYYVFVAVLLSLAICLIHLSAWPPASTSDNDIWIAVIEGNRNLTVLQADLFELQVTQWRASVEESGGMTPEHVDILLRVLRQINSKTKLVRVELEDLRQ